MSRPGQQHCTFCDLIAGAGEVSVCYEDADAVAFMDIQPVNPGHVLVVPRQHMESLFDVPRELGAHLFDVTMRVANAVRGVTGSEDMNIVVNSGIEAGQDELHYHVHIIPRRKDDGFDVPLPFDGSEMPDRTRLAAMAARIGSALSDPMRTARREGAAGGSEGGAERTASRGDARTSSSPAVARAESPRREAQPVVADRELPVQRAADMGRAGADAFEPLASDVAMTEGPHGELVRVEAIAD